jgi:hypothetical protein
MARIRITPAITTRNIIRANAIVAGTHCGDCASLTGAIWVCVREQVRAPPRPFGVLIGEIARTDWGPAAQVLLRLLGGTMPIRIGCDALLAVLAP